MPEHHVGCHSPGHNINTFVPEIFPAADKGVAAGQVECPPAGYSNKLVFQPLVIQYGGHGGGEDGKIGCAVEHHLADLKGFIQYLYLHRMSRAAVKAVDQPDHTHGRWSFKSCNCKLRMPAFVSSPAGRQQQNNYCQI